MSKSLFMAVSSNRKPTFLIKAMSYPQALAFAIIDTKSTISVDNGIWRLENGHLNGSPVYTILEASTFIEAMLAALKVLKWTVYPVTEEFCRVPAELIKIIHRPSVLDRLTQ